MTHRNRKLLYLFLVISFSLLYVLLPRNVYVSQSIQVSCADDCNSVAHDEVVTIFVHGIISVKPHLSVGNIIKLMSDNIVGSSYAQTVSIIRNDPFFYQYHPMQDLGLRPIEMKEIRPGDASAAFAHAFDYLDFLEKKTYKSAYYTFGWSGLLSPSMRYLEAEIFYQALLALINQLKAQNKNPRIRIVGYSHGGNVTLKLASVEANMPKESRLMIDELILIGVPILPDSYTLIHSPIFKKIYHFYSLADRIQNLDCFSFNRFFSERTFRARSTTVDLPSKLIQVRLEIRRPKNNKLRPGLLNYHQSRSVAPGHSEFYSFGWTHANFRPYHPFYPLPTATFAPYFIETLQKNGISSGLVTIEVHPYYETLIIKHMKKKIQTRFLSHQQLEQLKKHSHQFKPKNYSGDEYHRRVKDAIEKGKQIIKQKKATCRLSKKTKQGK